MKYPNVFALARRLFKPIVAFDVEHTGGAGSHRSITDFGAIVVSPEGAVTSYSSLVKPPEDVVFNHYVCKLTGIYPHTVADAPAFDRVLEEFVLPHRHGVWVGFNSRSSDTPLIYKESLRFGHELGPFVQIDLLRVPSSLEGSLSKRVAQIHPDFDTSGAHRAESDGLMTLMLLEHQLPHISEQDLQNQLAPPPPNSLFRGRKGATKTVTGAERRKMDVTQFLVSDGMKRNGHAWSEDEVLWICRMYRGGKKTVQELAALNGRTAFAVACALHKEGLIAEPERNGYRA